jgi:molecular chaperone DnaJ
MGFGFGGGPFESIFDAFLGGGRRRARGPARGQDIRYDLEITLEQAYKGLTSEIEIPRSERCNVCGGSGASPGTSPKTCPECAGTGQIEHVQSAGFMHFSRIEPCRKCRGRGIVIDKPCHECRGVGVVERERTISLNVPAGVDTGSQLIMRSEGDAPAGGGERGDLYVVVHVKPHQTFRREGDDLLCQVEVAYSKATLG